MSNIKLEIPKKIKEKFWIWEFVSYENLIIKTIWKKYISTDLKFNAYENMSESHKKEYDKLKNIDKTRLLNL